jgi:hypothetical protein
VYVCESRYSTKARAFKKIKVRLWWLFARLRDLTYFEGFWNAEMLLNAGFLDHETVGKGKEYMNPKYVNLQHCSI